MTLDTLSSTFAALADPTRRAILARLFSVPGQVSSKAKSDVLIVHTTD